jgi:hypothetical protein
VTLEQALARAREAKSAVDQWMPEGDSPALARAKATAMTAAGDLVEALEVAAATELSD